VELAFPPAFYVTMETPEFDPKKYGELLAQTLPVVIDNLQDHERLLTAAEALMDRGEDLSSEERKLLELLVVLVEIFEHEVEEADEQAQPLPHETLQRLMQSREMTAESLNDVFGNPKLTADILNGRKAISKGQAKALGKLFDVPPKLFFSE
jgi:HTH-type transcriptional regulator/antitoxin HigA